MLHRRTVVVAAISVVWPSVVGARLEDVHLVAAVRSELHMKHLTGDRVRRNPELIAMTELENLGAGAGLVHERVVRRHRAIVAQANHLAVRGIELSRIGSA